MKKIYYLLIFSVVICFTEFQVIRNKPNADYENVQNEKGYHFRYKTEDSERIEDGVLELEKGESGLISVSGFYSFAGTDGKTHTVHFVADENGYRPLVKSEEQPTRIKKPNTMLKRPPLVPYIGSAAIASLTGGGMG